MDTVGNGKSSKMKKSRSDSIPIRVMGPFATRPFVAQFMWVEYEATILIWIK